MSALPGSDSAAPSPDAPAQTSDAAAETASTTAPEPAEKPADKPAEKAADKGADKGADKAAKSAAKAAAKSERKAARAQRRTAKQAEREAALVDGPPRPKWNDLKQFGLILRSAHPRLAIVTALLVGIGAAWSGRRFVEALVAFGAVLLALLVTGLMNDVFDRALDEKSGQPHKAIADGRVPVGNATFVATGLTILLVPMALQNGTVAGLCIFGLLLVGLLHNRTLRRTPFSLLGWAASGVLLIFFLAYGGWGLGSHGSAPAPGMVLVAAMAGICAHLATSLTHLPFDHKAGIKPFPLIVGLRAGAQKVLLLTATLSAGTVVAFIIGALGTGLHS